MIERQLKGRGITDSRVLAAFRKIPREAFLAPELKSKAYEDHPLPIGYDQTISQPYIVAVMSESLELVRTDRILEVGTGSGYQTAVLAELGQEVCSVEIIEDLYQVAKMRLNTLGYRNIRLKHDDGRKGWVEHAPFDKIIVTAAAEKIPDVLVEQLKDMGRIILPIGQDDQDLVLGQKEKGMLVTRPLLRVRFVPLQN